mgnify:CR=1 FL=1
MMGLAIGCIGMSREDFLQSTPDEFNAIAEAYNNHSTMIHRTSWEQTRFMAQCMLMPYSKKTMKATDVIKFEWDTPEIKKVETTIPTKEDYERMKIRFGS